MYNYSITLKVVLRQAGLDFTVYPVIERRTDNPNTHIVERAVENRYGREHIGMVSIKAVRTSVRKVEKVA
jgi:hypothetical protein